MKTSKTMYRNIRNDNSIWRRFVKEDPVANRYKIAVIIFLIEIFETGKE